MMLYLGIFSGGIMFHIPYELPDPPPSFTTSHATTSEGLTPIDYDGDIDTELLEITKEIFRGTVALIAAPGSMGVRQATRIATETYWAARTDSRNRLIAEEWPADSVIEQERADAAAERFFQHEKERYVYTMTPAETMDRSVPDSTGESVKEGDPYPVTIPSHRGSQR